MTDKFFIGAMITCGILLVFTMGYSLGYSTAIQDFEDDAVKNGRGVRVTWNTFRSPYVKREFFWNDMPRPHFIGERVEGKDWKAND